MWIVIQLLVRFDICSAELGEKNLFCVIQWLLNVCQHLCEVCKKKKEYEPDETWDATWIQFCLKCNSGL